MMMHVSSLVARRGGRTHFFSKSPCTRSLMIGMRLYTCLPTQWSVKYTARPPATAPYVTADGPQVVARRTATVATVGCVASDDLNVSRQYLSLKPCKSGRARLYAHAQRAYIAGHRAIARVRRDSRVMRRKRRKLPHQQPGRCTFSSQQAALFPGALASCTILDHGRRRGASASSP